MFILDDLLQKLARPIFRHCFTDAFEQQPQISLSNTQGYPFDNRAHGRGRHFLRLNYGEKVIFLGKDPLMRGREVFFYFVSRAQASEENLDALSLSSCCSNEITCEILDRSGRTQVSKQNSGFVLR